MCLAWCMWVGVYYSQPAHFAQSCDAHEKTMEPAHFIHLTDLHILSRETSRQSAIIEALLQRIESITSEVPVHAVFITGDIAYTGKKSDYDRITKQLISPLKNLVPGIPILIVPGNHDLDCDRSCPPSWKQMGRRRRDAWFDESQEGIGVRRQRAESFTDFESFIVDNEIIAPRPSQNVSLSKVLNFGSAGTFRFILTNTAFFSDKEKDVIEKEETPAPTPSLRHVINTSKNEEFDYTFILAHHPISWFLGRFRTPLLNLLQENSAIYFHGHTHINEVLFGSKGLLSLGLCAGYAVPLDAEPTPYYRNGLALYAWDEGLHTRIWNWSNEAGRWEDASSLPSGFEEKSRVLDGGYYFPLGKSSKSPKRRVHQRDDHIHTPLLLDRVRAIRDLSPHDLLSILREYSILPLEFQAERKVIREGVEELVIEAGKNENRHRARIISARGNILSREQVESANTSIDYEGLASFTILSIGELSADGKTSYLRLSVRKPISIDTQASIAGKIVEAWPEDAKKTIGSFDAAEVDAEVLLFEGKAFCCFIDRVSSSWFVVADSNGNFIEESAPLVRALRLVTPSLAYSGYGDKLAGKQTSPRSEYFDRADYLEKCYKEFNSVRYAALATFGLRLNRTTLDDLYVEASADTESGDSAEVALCRAVDDMLQSLPISDARIRVQLEGQLRRKLRRNPSDSGYARKLYQRHGCIIVLGDPGSGKTLFAKHEILAYCQPPEENASWYERHLPVYIPLAEAARTIDWGEKTIDILLLAARMSARYSLPLSPAHARAFDDAGHLAIFFDGLDEVVSLEQRLELFEAISRYSIAAKAKGNRVIVTSRPAAVRMLNVKDSILSVVSLRGLNITEMRELARRILSSRVTEGDVSIPLSNKKCSDSDSSLIERMISDCQKIPGIGRIARNPLLFTLLTMTYANHGPLAAKRHRVYEEAVETLVSVRTRFAGQHEKRMLSLSDLRRRLGAVALSAYKDPRTTIPSWDQVCTKVQETISSERDAPISRKGAEEYVQKVAESTGILVLHRDEKAPGNGNITFMHQSFMEYYAAVGLFSLTNYIDEAVNVSRLARWTETLILLAGIVAAHSDSTTLIRNLLENSNEVDAITLNRLLFVFECALECDVPPERAQVLLISAVREAFQGVLLFDGEMRAKVCEKVAALYDSAVRDEIDSMIEEGAGSDSSEIAAAYIGFLGELANRVEVSDRLMEVFRKVCSRKEQAVLISLCEAIGESEKLRSCQEGVSEVLPEAFKGSIPVRYAAVSAVEKAPGLAKVYVWDELRSLLAERKPYLSIPAINAFLKVGWKVSISSTDSKGSKVSSELLNALEGLVRWGDERQISGLGKSVPRGKVESLLSSANMEHILIGIYLLPFVRDDEKFVHDTLIELIRETDSHKVSAAAIGAFRLSYDVLSLVTIGDIDLLREKLKSRYRNVRLAASRLLGSFINEIAVVDTLIEYARKSGSDHVEFETAIRELARITPSDDGFERVQLFLQQQLTKKLTSASKKNLYNERVLQIVVEGLCSLEVPADEGFYAKAESAAASRTYSIETRRGLFRYLGIATPIESRHARKMLTHIEKIRDELASPTLEMVSKYFERCSRSVDSIRIVVSLFPKIKKALLERSKTLFGRLPNEDSGRQVHLIRNTLDSIQQMEQTYKEVVHYTHCATAN